MPLCVRKVSAIDFETKLWIVFFLGGVTTSLLLIEYPGIDDLCNISSEIDVLKSTVTEQSRMAYFFVTMKPKTFVTSQDIFTTRRSGCCGREPRSYAAEQLRGKTACLIAHKDMSTDDQETWQRTWKSVAGVSCCCPAALSSSPSGAALFSVSAPRHLLCSPLPTAWTKQQQQNKKKTKTEHG